ncbi:MAG: sigma-70 family RNA polymerase sigma factor [Verrucomicrobiota bacterium]
MQSDLTEIFKKWLNDYEALVYKVVHSFAQSPEDKRELFSEILFQIWSSIPNFKENCAETTWIYRVAFNAAMNWKRRLKKDAQTWASLDGIDFSQLATSDRDPDPRLQALYQAIRTLPESTASFVIMHLDGLSYQEMAEISGISTNAVGVKLNRAKKKLAEIMKGLTDGNE